MAPVARLRRSRASNARPSSSRRSSSSESSRVSKSVAPSGAPSSSTSRASVCRKVSPSSSNRAASRSRRSGCQTSSWSLSAIRGRVVLATARSKLAVTPDGVVPASTTTSGDTPLAAPSSTMEATTSSVPSVDPSSETTSLVRRTCLVEDALHLGLDIGGPVVGAQGDRDLCGHVTSASGPPRARRGTFPP